MQRSTAELVCPDLNFVIVLLMLNVADAVSISCKLQRLRSGTYENQMAQVHAWVNAAIREHEYHHSYATINLLSFMPVIQSMPVEEIIDLMERDIVQIMIVIPLVETQRTELSLREKTDKHSVYTTNLKDFHIQTHRHLRSRQIFSLQRTA